MLKQLIIDGQHLEMPNDDEQLTRSEFSIWLNESIYFLELYYSKSILTKKFIREYEEGTHKNSYYYNSMLSILEGLKKLEDKETIERIELETINNANRW